MADKKITVVKTTKPDEAAAVTFTALGTSDKVLIPCQFKDEHTQLWFLGGSGKANVTIKAGDGYAAVNDEVFEVPASGYRALTINSARFKKFEGDDKGYIELSVDAACSVAVVEARV